MVISPPGSSGSSSGLPGEFTSSFGSERSCSHSDVSLSFLSRFLSSLIIHDASDVVASALTGLSSQLRSRHLSPLSSMLGDFILWSRGLVWAGEWWRWLWGCSRYVLDICFIALTVFFISCHRSCVRRRIQFLPLNRCFPMRHGTLHLDPCILAYTCDLSLNCCICTFNCGALVLFGLSLPPWVHLHT